MHQLRTLLPFLKPYRRGVFIGLFFVILSNVFAIPQPDLLGRAIDALRKPNGSLASIWKYALLLVGLAVLSGLARYAMREILNGISRRVETDVRNAFFDKLMALDATFYGTTRTGDLMSRAVNDVGTVRMAAGPAVMYLVSTAVMVPLAIGYMLHISPRLTVLALIPMTLIPWVMIHFGRRIHAQSESIQEHLGIISTLVQENLAGARIVRAYVQEREQQREFETLNEQYLEKNMHLARTQGVFNPLLTLLAGMGSLLVLWVGGTQALNGRISIGDFVAFGIYLSMLTWPMIALGWVINLFQRGAASMGRVNFVLQAQATITDAPRPVVLEDISGDVVFRDVWFRYPGSEHDVLKGISFRAHAGSTVAIVGPTGSGKSTIVALLARMYDPTRGKILLDGIPIDELSLRQLRGAIGLVPQDSFVFSETIAENIGYGVADFISSASASGSPSTTNPRIPGDVDFEVPEIIERASRVARLDEAIESFPWGYNTRLGERGVNLSGGQRQRTTLARAIARDPRILVLDDSLSAVDTQTETEILRGLRDVLEQRTSFIISHRVTAVMNADLILVLDRGVIVESGTHPELIQRDGLYASLLHRQLIEEDLEADAVSGDGGGLHAANARSNFGIR
jgi:ATP-binding cassette, subfamily B, multidrug efflux pump